MTCSITDALADDCGALTNTASLATPLTEGFDFSQLVLSRDQMHTSNPAGFGFLVEKCGTMLSLTPTTSR
jgi:hypothetical protein